MPRTLAVHLPGTLKMKTGNKPSRSMPNLCIAGLRLDFGLFLVTVGLYALLFVAPLTAPRVIAGVVLVVLGCNMLAAAYRAKESWLSRLGPLP